MANCVTKKVLKSRIVESWEQQYDLRLTREEAQTLRDVLALISGVSSNTRRKDTEAISEALAAVGIIANHPVSDVHNDYREIRFVPDESKGYDW